jgi:O-Glycosyl hydrolase
MKKNYLKFVGLLLISLFFLQGTAQAQRSATVKVDKSITHQKITGFGGFVNSPQFGYNHMSTAEIRKMWGKDSETGYNIMRLYIPTGESSWNQSVITTAKLAKELGLIVFASPWSMPASMKTINTTNGQSGGQANYLKEESYAEYAEYLNKFVVLLRNNGVELDAISIQNEPNYRTDYAGCIWTSAQMTKFLRENRHLISCPVMAPETTGMDNEFANALLADNVIDHIDIYGGHQYSSLGTAHRNFHAKGKQVWMTEYLINWNEGQSTDRNFDWSRDVFNFADKINVCMLQNVNAWIHYATKRWYAMLGDGGMGTTNSVITKRGYVLSHYAKFTTGTTRIENTWTDTNSNPRLSGSSYLSATGDSVVIMVMNSSTSSYSLTVDLPFNTLSGKRITTTQTDNMVETALTYDAETARPVVELSASSVNTLIFVKSGETGIDKILVENGLKAWTQNGELFINGLTIGKPWKVYDTSSSLVYSGVASGNEEIVSLPAKGVYIVVSEGNATKVVY